MTSSSFRRSGSLRSFSPNAGSNPAGGNYGALAICIPRLPARELNRILGLERLDSLGELDKFFRERRVHYIVSLDPETGLGSELEARGYSPGYAWAKFERGAAGPPEAPTDLRLELAGPTQGRDLGLAFAEGYGMPEFPCPSAGQRRRPCCRSER